MLRKYLPLFIILISALYPALAEAKLADTLSGRILLQVEANGEAWYIYPGDTKRYYLGRPADAFEIMRGLGIGISDADLAKIPVGLTTYVSDDSDGDGLSDKMEESLNTDLGKADSDNDGHSDKEEVLGGYNPNGSGNLGIDTAFAERQKGNIFIQTEKQGQAWYVSPVDAKRYYLGKPLDAFIIMRELGLGITNENLSTIFIGYYNLPTDPDTCVNCAEDGPEAVYRAAVTAIMKGEKEKALSYFVEEMQSGVGWTFEFLDDEGLYFFGNILSGAKMTEKTATRATFTTTVKFNAWENDHTVVVEKQDDGSWKLINL